MVIKDLQGHEQISLFGGEGPNLQVPLRGINTKTSCPKNSDNARVSMVSFEIRLHPTLNYTILYETVSFQAAPRPGRRHSTIWLLPL